MHTVYLPFHPLISNSINFQSRLSGLSDLFEFYPNCWKAIPGIYLSNIIFKLGSNLVKIECVSLINGLIQSTLKLVPYTPWQTSNCRLIIRARQKAIRIAIMRHQFTFVRFCVQCVAIEICITRCIVEKCWKWRGEFLAKRNRIEGSNASNKYMLMSDK